MILLPGKAARNVGRSANCPSCNSHMTAPAGSVIQPMQFSGGLHAHSDGSMVTNRFAEWFAFDCLDCGRRFWTTEGEQVSPCSCGKDSAANGH